MSETKLRILFVDDDELLLSALKRMLRGQSGQWDMTFVASGREALEQMERGPFDVVVSDMRMPEMDGAQLLSEVERRYPATIRIILSGYADDPSIFRSIGPAHQYVAKPCEPEEIIAFMTRSLHLRNVLKQPGLRQLVTGLRTLPSVPDLYLRVTDEIRREDGSASSVAHLIGKDVAMTAELLRITNSSYFALQAHVTSIIQAVRLLGMETVRTLVLAVGIFRHHDGIEGASRLIKGLSQHGIRIGQLARSLATADGGKEPVLDQAFCAGMLSAVGALILLNTMPQRYIEFLQGNDADDVEAEERRRFGASQAELGAYLLGLWGFADPVVEAVLYQSHPSECVYQQKSVLSYLHLARVLGPPFPLLAKGERPPLDADYAQRIGLDHAALAENLPPDAGVPS